MATHLHTDLLGLSEQRSRPSTLQTSSDGRGDAFRRVLSAPSEKSEPNAADAPGAKPSEEKLTSQDQNLPEKVTLPREGAPETPGTGEQKSDSETAKAPDMLAAGDIPVETAKHSAKPRTDTADPTVRADTMETAGSAVRLGANAETIVAADDARRSPDGKLDGKTPPEAKAGTTDAALIPAKAGAASDLQAQRPAQAPGSTGADGASEALARTDPSTERQSGDTMRQAVQSEDAIKIAAPAAEASQATTISPVMDATGTDRARKTQADGTPGVASTAGTITAETDEAVDMKPSRDARSATPVIDHPAPSAAPASDSAFSISADIKSVERLVASGDGLSGQGETLTFTTGPAASSTSASAVAQTGNVQFMQAMRAQAPMIATPGEITEIIQTRLAGSDGGNRITVQLDPPELGRVSIDFKFDAQGLQHITITGETPEALKQLRQVHFQLTQALEQQGLSGQDMTFRQQSFGQHQNQQDPSGFSGFSGPTGEALADTITHAAMTPSRMLLPGGGLDMKL